MITFSTEQIYQSTLKTPGEPRYINKSILENAISDGVINGIFGLGILENNTPKCEYYKKSPIHLFIGKRSNHSRWVVQGNSR